MAAGPAKGGDGLPDKPGGESEAAQRAKRLRAKNITLLIALVAFVVLVYFVSIVRMGGS